MNRNLQVTFLGIVGAVMLAQAAFGQVFLPGSQPGQGRTLAGPGNCGCHSGYNIAVEPVYTWRGSMMSQAARDPLFFAALDIANYDIPGVGDFCLRCHTPNAYLNGRTFPAVDGSAMTGDDFEGVFCDFCHAMVDPLSTEANGLVEPDVPTYGMGMFVITNTAERRGPYSDATATHQWQYSAFHRSSNICGQCHDVSNPTNCPPGEPYNTQECFEVERTFSEWSNSAYPAMGEAGNCQSCHMPHIANDKAAKQGNVRTFLPIHQQNGGNTWAPDAIKYMYPGQWDAELDAGKARALALLQTSATLEAFDKTDTGAGNIDVKVTNLTGHKLPTGYPEGRRMWINIKGYNSSAALVFESANYNSSTAVLTHDSQVKIYEAEPGMISGLDCNPTFHFVLNNCIHQDNRIPPLGFTNAAFEADGAGVVGYFYADGQYWDYTPYQLPTDVVSVTVNLYYQTASKEYIDFLATAPGAGARGATLLNVYNNTGKSAPVLMETVTISIDNDMDGMGNAWETLYGLNPNSAADAALDGDSDTRTNLQEYNDGTAPNDADSDDDALDDGAEIAVGTSATNPDFDGDGILDGHDYYNPTTNPLVSDVPCYNGMASLGLYCWGDVDNNGILSLNDMVGVNNYILLNVSTFPNVYPSNANNLDLNGDLVIGLADLTIMRNWLLLKADGSARPPTQLSVVSPISNPTVPIGSTQAIVLEVKNANNNPVAGANVVFTVSGNGVLLGGRGDAFGVTDPDGGLFPAGSRWDVTGEWTDGGIVTMFVKVTGAGPIIVNAKVVRNGSKGSPASVPLGAPITINP